MVVLLLNVDISHVQGVLLPQTSRPSDWLVNFFSLLRVNSYGPSHTRLASTKVQKHGVGVATDCRSIADQSQISAWPLIDWAAVTQSSISQRRSTIDRQPMKMIADNFSCNEILVTHLQPYDQNCRQEVGDHWGLNRDISSTTSWCFLCFCKRW